MADLDPLSFRGTSPQECEEFVNTIRRRALAQGKHLDNAWIAFLASSCLVGDAFYWYEELDEDVQNDWRRLRPALVARFGRGALTSTTTSGSSWAPPSAPFTTIPTPAAAPPTVVTHPLVRKGHLKVLSSDGSLHGYFAKAPNEDGSYTVLSENVGDALLVSFTILSADKAFEIQIINSSQHPRTSDFLAISWLYTCGNRWMDDITYIAWCCSFLTITSTSDWAIERKVWKISTEGELSVEYPKPDGATERLYCHIDWDIVDFLKLFPVESERGRLVFEDAA